ncbi:MAG: XRE family transcriptional regulator [bacterium]|nr:XRE family transcriptional regulator [bacterium]
MTVAHVNPAVLQWAADRADLGSDDLSRSLRQSVSTVERWLDGSSAPTFSQAQKLAKRLRVPFGYLFLADPPVDELPIPDFRRAPGGAYRRPSVDLRDVIADVLRHQDWYRDFRVGADEPPLPVVGRFSTQAPVSAVAADIALSLNLDSEVRCETQRDRFLRAFVRQVEALGILVMRNGVVHQATNRPLRVEEFRGFSIADPMAPVIFINNADSHSAQIFTLAHELAHIWVGEGGISDADLTIPGGGSTHIEAYCNEVAGEVLLPWDRIADSWKRRTSSESEWLGGVAAEFRVSTVMVARQLWTHGAISRQRFFELYEAERAKWNAQRATTSSGGDYYKNVPIRNSRLLTEAVLESVGASEMLIRDASRLLGVKPANLPKLRASLGGT